MITKCLTPCDAKDKWNTLRSQIATANTTEDKTIVLLGITGGGSE